MLLSALIFLPLPWVATAEQAPPATITIAPGTRILTVLKSSLHTTSATSGSGVYLETAFPVVQDHRVIIPVRTQILGVVEEDKRPGRVKGRAHLRFRFTNLILPNYYVVPIDGALQSLPGSRSIRTGGERGDIEPVDQIDRDVHTIAGSAAIGSALGVFAHGAIGPGVGALIGVGVGVGRVLFSRGDAISLPAGSSLELILQQPIILPKDKMPGTFEAAPGAESGVLKQSAEAEPPGNPKLKRRGRIAERIFNR